MPSPIISNLRSSQTSETKLISLAVDGSETLKVKCLSNFTTSMGKSLTYFKEAYPAPKSSRAILIPLFFRTFNDSEATFISASSAVSVTSRPN